MRSVDHIQGSLRIKCVFPSNKTLSPNVAFYPITLSSHTMNPCSNLTGTSDGRTTDSRDSHWYNPLIVQRFVFYPPLTVTPTSIIYWSPQGRRDRCCGQSVVFGDMNYPQTDVACRRLAHLQYHGLHNSTISEIIDANVSIFTHTVVSGKQSTRRLAYSIPSDPEDHVPLVHPTISSVPIFVNREGCVITDHLWSFSNASTQIT